MKLLDIIENKVPAQKPRNFVAKNAMKTTSGAGKHKDKKKAAKQGEVKHKSRMAEDQLNELSFEEIKSFYVTYKVITEWGIPLVVMATIVAGLGIAAAVKLIKQGKDAVIKKYREIKGTVNPDDVSDAAKKIKNVGDKNKDGVSEGNEPDEGYLDKVISDLHKDALGMRPDREFGREWMSSSYEEKLEIYNNMLKNLHSDMDEGIGGTIAGGVGQFIGNKIDPLAGEIMRAHGEIAGRKAEYTIRKYMHLLQKALKQQLDSGEKEGVAEGGDVFYTAGETANKKPVGKGTTVKNKITGIVGKAYSWSVVKGVPYLYVKGDDDRYQSPAKDWLVVDEQGVSEASDWGEPREILEDVLQTLEREVEWPLTEVMDPKQVRQLLSPLVRAVNDKMMSMEEGQDDWGSMSHSEFKRKELQHELGHEDDPEFQRQMREKDRGPWYIKINGRIYKQKGQPKAFDWKKGANNYALAMLKNKPELKTKTVLTRKPVDDVVETATIASTSAGNVTVGAVYPNKKGKTPKNKDGTAKNALDMGANLLTGGSIKRR